MLIIKGTRFISAGFWTAQPYLDTLHICSNRDIITILAVRPHSHLQMVLSLITCMNPSGDYRQINVGGSPIDNDWCLYVIAHVVCVQGRSLAGLWAIKCEQAPLAAGVVSLSFISMGLPPASNHWEPPLGFSHVISDGQHTSL